MYGAPYAEAYAAAAAAAAQDPYASVAYYQMAADAASGAYAGAYMDVDPSAEIPVPEYEPQPEVATPAPRKAPKPRVKQQQQQQHAPITVRKNSVKAMCRPTAPEGHQPCEAIDVYGEWEAGSGRYRMPVRRVTVDGTTMQTVAGSEMRHLQGCSMIGVLFPTPGDLTCRSCGQTFSTTFNAASHGICRDNHFRCPPCDKSVTTLAAIQKHFKTPKHRQSTDGWTVDGEVKHKSVLERIHNGGSETLICYQKIFADPLFPEAVNVQAQRNNKDTGDD